jgi:predicted kinase
MASVPIMAIMMGIPGSGKSSFCARKLLNYKRVNLDSLHTRNNENIAIEEAIKHRENIVIDNTNPTAEDRRKYILKAKESGYLVIGYFMQSVFLDCLKRNDSRTGKAKLSYKAIASVSKKLEMPSYGEGFDKIYFVRISEEEFQIEDWRIE